MCFWCWFLLIMMECPEGYWNMTFRTVPQLLLSMNCLSSSSGMSHIFLWFPSVFPLFIGDFHRFSMFHDPPNSPLPSPGPVSKPRWSPPFPTTPPSFARAWRDGSSRGNASGCIRRRRRMIGHQWFSRRLSFSDFFLKDFMWCLRSCKKGCQKGGLTSNLLISKNFLRTLKCGDSFCFLNLGLTRHWRAFFETPVSWYHTESNLMFCNVTLHIVGALTHPGPSCSGSTMAP